MTKPELPRRQTSPARVLFVLNDSRFFVSHRLLLARGLRDAGYDVHVAAAAEDGVNAILAAGFPFHPIPLQKQGLNPFADVRALSEIFRLYRRLRPSIVHHVTIKAVLYGTVAARMARVPAVVNAVAGLGTLFAGGSPLADLRRGAMRTIYAASVRHPNLHFIFQNTEDRDTFFRARLADANRSVLIQGSGADLRLISPSPEPDGPPLVVLVARLLRQKGVEEFAEAARRLRAAGVPGRFALVGDSASNRDAVPRAVLDQWRDEGVVEVWGWRDDMDAVLAQAAIACLPSYYPEGVPKALIDAAAAGLPIVTTTMPGCRETVIDGVNGLLVPPRDVDALTDALRRLLLDADLRRRFGAASRKLAEDRFSIDAVIHSTLEVYERALGARQLQKVS